MVLTREDEEERKKRKRRMTATTNSKKKRSIINLYLFFSEHLSQHIRYITGALKMIEQLPKYEHERALSPEDNEEKTGGSL